MNGEDFVKREGFVPRPNAYSANFHHMISQLLNGVPPPISCTFPRAFCYWRCFWPQSSIRFTSRWGKVFLHMPRLSIPCSDLLESTLDGARPSNHRPATGICVPLCTPRRSRTLSIHQWPSVSVFCFPGNKIFILHASRSSAHPTITQTNSENGSTRLVITCHNCHWTPGHHEMGERAIPESSSKTSQMGLDDWSGLTCSVSYPPGKYLSFWFILSVPPSEFGRVRCFFITLSVSALAC